MSRILVLFGLICLSACEPIGPIPGGKLDGQIQPVPENWDRALSIDTVQVETRPDNPYSINIWAVGSGPDFYIATSDDSNWVKYLEADPSIRLRLDQDLFELSAIRVDDTEELAEVRKSYIEKYDIEEESMSSDSVVYRLGPR